MSRLDLWLHRVMGALIVAFPFVYIFAVIFFVR